MNKPITDTSKHEHNIEYGQVAGDFPKDLMQMRCTICGYQSYSLLRPSELSRLTEKDS